MAEQSIPVQAYANGKPAALSTFTKAVYSLTPENEVGERLDHTLENIESRIKELESTPEPGFNLLVNSRFAYNGRNQSSYTATGTAIYTVDGWRLRDNSTLTIEDNGVTVSCTSDGVCELLEYVSVDYSVFSGKTLTVSAKVGNTIYFSSGAVPEVQPEKTTIIAQTTLPNDFILSLYWSSVSSAFFVSISNNSAQTGDSFIASAAKLELGSVSTLAADLAQGQDEAIEQLRLDMYDLDPGRPAWVLTQNENLLDNAYFVGGGSQQGRGQFPINQKGQTSYSGTAQNAIDRWKISPLSTSFTTGSLLVQSNGINLENGAGNSLYFNQIIPDTLSSALNGKIVTLSFLISDISGSWVISEYAKSGKVFSSSGLVAYSFVWDDSVDIKRVQLWSLSNGEGSITLQAAKLELGTRSTLARLVDGEWVLNDPPPNFQQELAKCQRYQNQIFYNTGAPCLPYAVGTSETTAEVIIPLSVPLRIITSISMSNLTLAEVNSGNVRYPITGYNIARFNNSFVKINFQISGGGIVLGKAYGFSPLENEKASLLLDANL